MKFIVALSLLISCVHHTVYTAAHEQPDNPTQAYIELALSALERTFPGAVIQQSLYDDTHFNQHMDLLQSLASKDSLRELHEWSFPFTDNPADDLRVYVEAKLPLIAKKLPPSEH